MPASPWPQANPLVHSGALCSLPPILKRDCQGPLSFPLGNHFTAQPTREALPNLSLDLLVSALHLWVFLPRKTMHFKANSSHVLFSWQSRHLTHRSINRTGLFLTQGPLVSESWTASRATQLEDYAVSHIWRSVIDFLLVQDPRLFHVSLLLMFVMTDKDQTLGFISLKGRAGQTVEIGSKILTSVDKLKPAEINDIKCWASGRDRIRQIWSPGQD